MSKIDLILTISIISWGVLCWLTFMRFKSFRRERALLRKRHEDFTKHMKECYSVLDKYHQVLLSIEQIKEDLHQTKLSADRMEKIGTKVLNSNMGILMAIENKTDDDSQFNAPFHNS